MSEQIRKVRTREFSGSFCADETILSMTLNDGILTLEALGYGGDNYRVYFYDVENLSLKFAMAKTGGFSGWVTDSSAGKQGSRKLLSISIEDGEGEISFSYERATMEWEESPRPHISFFGIRI